MCQLPKYLSAFFHNLPCDVDNMSDINVKMLETSELNGGCYHRIPFFPPYAPIPNAILEK